MKCILHMQRTRPALALCGVAICLALHGCVTERPRRGPAAPPGTAQLPPGPVAAPVLDATSNSSVSVAVLPLGSVAYDGQVLPQLSPDGRFAAVEEGEAPTWPTLLAQPGARPALRTTIAAYDLSGASPIRIV